MVNRETSSEIWREIVDTISQIKKRARKINDIETVKDAERLDALIQGLGIELHLEDLKSESR